MTRSSRSARVRPPRLVLRWLLMVLAGLLLLPTVWGVMHRIDVAPSADAQALHAPLAPEPSDADNAWMHLLGIGADADEAPHRFARRRLEALSQDPPRPLAEPVPAVAPTREVHGFDDYCDARERSCIDWAWRHAEGLDALRDANALRLSRLPAILPLPGWQVGTPSALDNPYVDTSLFTLRTQLLALDLARSLQQHDAEATGVALAELGALVAFWRGVQRGPQDLVSLMVAARNIETLQRLAHDLLARLHARDLETHTPALLALLAPPPEIDWRRVVQQQQQSFEQAVREATPGVIAGIRTCFDPAHEHCLRDLLVSASLARQDTANHHAKIMRGMLAWLQAPPGDTRLAAEREFGRAVEAVMVPFEDNGALFEYFRFNPAGKILAAVATPAFPYRDRLQDQEALRRMFLLALQQRRLGERMDWLADTPELPNTTPAGQSFDHDDVWDELLYVPLDAAHWKRDALRVTLPASRPMVQPCRVVLALRLAAQDAPAAPSAEFGACGSGLEASLQDEAAEQDLAFAAALESVRLRLRGDTVYVRVSRDAGAEMQRHEGELSLADPSEPVALQAANDAPVLLARLLAITDQTWVSLDAAAVEAPLLLRELAQVGAVRLEGLAAVPPTPVSLRGDLPLQTALREVAQRAGVQIEFSPGAATLRR